MGVLCILVNNKGLVNLNAASRDLYYLHNCVNNKMLQHDWLLLQPLFMP